MPTHALCHPQGLGRLIALFLSLALTACGGGGGDAAPEVAAAQGPTAHALAGSEATVPDPVQVLTLSKISETRISRTVYDYVFRVSVQNKGQALAVVKAMLIGAGTGTTIIDGMVEVGELAAGAIANPVDTITLRHDRGVAFNQAALVWRVLSSPAVPAIVPGASLFNLPADQALVGSLYQATLKLAPVDERNTITSLQLSNPTPGGAATAISLQGLLSWTPNEADFATTLLRLTVGLQDGSSASFEVPVVVTRSRPVAQLVLNGAGRYSDPEGRYLINVSAALAGAPVTGTLTITERYDVSGTYAPVITSTDVSHIIELIDAPIGLPSAQGLAGTARSGRAKALAAGNPRPLASSAALPVIEQIHGQKIDTDTNLYTTRHAVMHPSGRVYSPVVVAQIDANCSRAIANDCERLAGTPVILIHGFLPEALTANAAANPFGSFGGGVGTWGKLAEVLTAQDHPVFELRWQTQMRFEEAAGLLVRLGNQVAAATGRKPFIIAHSFGGVLAHLALAGEGMTWNPLARGWDRMSAGTADQPLFDGLITLGSPLSGINDNDATRSSIFVYGRYFADRSIDGCMSVTCVQAGAFDVGALDDLKRNVALVDGVASTRPVLSPGESIEVIRKAWSKGAIYLPAEKIHTVVSLRERPNDFGPEMSRAQGYALGDGLISMPGQAVLGDDFTCTTTIPTPSNYDIPGCLASRGIADFYASIKKPIAVNARDSLVHAKLSGRNYHFASRAAHSSAQSGKLKLLTNKDLRGILGLPDYLIAHYEDQVVVGETCDSTGCKQYTASHPLTYFLDHPDILARGTPTPATQPTVTSRIKAKLVVPGTNFNLSTVPAWISILRHDSERPVRNKRALLPFISAAGDIAFDAAQLLRSELGSDVLLSDYRIRIEVGDGLVFSTATATSDRLRTDSAEYALGEITSQSVAAQAALVTVTGIATVAGSAAVVGGAEVWLVRGVNLSAVDVKGAASSNISRHVVTDANGAFSVVGLRPGDYTVLASRSGYSDNLIGRLTVDGSQSISISLKPLALFFDAFDGASLDLSKWFIDPPSSVCCGTGNIATFNLSDGFLNVVVPGGSCGSCGRSDGAAFRPNIAALAGDFEMLVSGEELARLSRDGRKALGNVQLVLASGSYQLGIYIIGDALNNSGASGHAIYMYSAVPNGVDYVNTRSLVVGQYYAFQFRIRRGGNQMFLAHRLAQDADWTEVSVRQTFPVGTAFTPRIWFATGDGGGTQVNSSLKAKLDFVSIR